MSRPGVLLDRDGTIIVDDGYVGSVERIRFIDGAIEAVAELNRAGIPVAVVTNQAGVARGLYDVEDVQQVHKFMIEEMARQGARVDLWLFCPYHPDGTVESFARTSLDRKPAPGMALAAAQTLELDLATSWVVGDSEADMGLARAVGARGLFIGPEHDDPGITAVPDLATAVRLILASDAPETPFPPPFPTIAYAAADSFGRDYAAQLALALDSVVPEAIAAAGDLLNRAYDRDATVFACGNGGSASIANHLQCDHVKGVRMGTDLRTRVISLAANMELFSAIANDNGYENVFEFQLQSMARPGDVLLVVSSSGRSPNVVRALEWARANEVRSIALTGFGGGRCRELADVAVHVRSDNYGIVEDAHQACMHLLAQYVRQSRMSPAAIAAGVF